MNITHTFNESMHVLNPCVEQGVYYKVLYQDLTAQWLATFAVLGFLTACVMFGIILFIKHRIPPKKAA